MLLRKYRLVTIAVFRYPVRHTTSYILEIVLIKVNNIITRNVEEINQT